MSTGIVVFQNLDDVLEFVKKVEKYPYNMDVRRGKFVVDARSLLSLVNLGFQKEIELIVYEDNCEDFWQDIEKYVAA